MTAPDPSACFASRFAADRITCGKPEDAHCTRCQACPDTCDCATRPWKKGDRVRITFDAVYLTEPSIKSDRYALVVLPGTDLDGNVLLMDRFRVPLEAITKLDNE